MHGVMLAYHHQMAVGFEHYGQQAATDGVDLTAGGCCIVLKRTKCIKAILQVLWVSAAAHELQIFILPQVNTLVLPHASLGFHFCVPCVFLFIGLKSHQACRSFHSSDSALEVTLGRRDLLYQHRRPRCKPSCSRLG